MTKQEWRQAANEAWDKHYNSIPEDARRLIFGSPFDPAPPGVGDMCKLIFINNFLLDALVKATANQEHQEQTVEWMSVQEN